MRAAYAGEVHLDPAVARLLAQRMRESASEPPPVEPLTEREKEVLSLVGQGASNKEIATALFITERTARTHVSNILGKLGLRQPHPGRAVGGRPQAGGPAQLIRAAAEAVGRAGAGAGPGRGRGRARAAPGRAAPGRAGPGPVRPHAGPM